MRQTRCAIHDASPHGPDVVMDPLGVRGMAGLGLCGVAPAIANAVWHATGKPVREFPITPDRLPMSWVHGRVEPMAELVAGCPGGETPRFDRDCHVREHPPLKLDCRKPRRPEAARASFPAGAEGGWVSLGACRVRDRVAAGALLGSAETGRVMADVPDHKDAEVTRSSSTLL